MYGPKTVYSSVFFLICCTCACSLLFIVMKKITATLDCYFRKTVKIESFALRAVILIVLGTL